MRRSSSKHDSCIHETPDDADYFEQEAETLTISLLHLQVQCFERNGTENLPSIIKYAMYSLDLHTKHAAHLMLRQNS